MNLFREKAHSFFASSLSESEYQLRRLAEQTQLVTALLQAGLSPTASAEHAGLTLAELGAARAPEPAAFFHSVWNFAVNTGAAPASVLKVCAEAFSDAAENARQARVQLAGPQAATRLVMLLPALALLGGFLAGYNPLQFLLGSVLGWLVLFFAAGLIVLSGRWSHRMVTSAQQWNWSRGMAAEVMAISLQAGQSLQQAKKWADQISRDYSSNPETARQEQLQCDQYVALAHQTGVALSGLLRAQAQQERNAARDEAQIRVEKLSVQLMIPLGVCVLPAFIAVGVLPLVASVISSTALNS
ncbi:MAG: hypothetical protein RI926_919 [Actinomycetota bacterium]